MTSKYTLTDSERDIFMNKILPVSLIGCLIWLLGEIIFGFLFIGNPEGFIYIYFAMWLVNLLIFFISYFIARWGKNILGIMVFFIFCFFSGILSVPIYIWTNFGIYLYAIISVGIGGVAIVYITGLILGDNFFNKGYFWVHIIIIVILIIIMEVIMVLLLGVTNPFSVVTSVILLLIVIGDLMLYGVPLAKKIKEEYWLFWGLRVLLLLLYGVIAIVLMIIIIIICAAFDGGGAPDIWFIGSSSDSSTGSIKEKKKYEK